MSENLNLAQATETAAILTDALPFIQEFFGKTIVIKYGGNAMINEDLKEKVMTDIALMKYVGIRPVIIHGGGPDITGFLKKVGKQSEFVSGLRVTDEETVREQKENISKQTVEIADKVVDKQMRIVQEIASLLGETAAETKIALSKLKESISNE